VLSEFFTPSGISVKLLAENCDQQDDPVHTGKPLTTLPWTPSQSRAGPPVLGVIMFCRHPAAHPPVVATEAALVKGTIVKLA